MPRATSTDRPRHAEPAGPTSSARLAAKLLAFAAREGQAAALGSAAQAIAPERLADPEARVPLASVYALIEALAAACAEGSGLRFARAIEIGDFDALGFLMMTSATVGAALERFVAFQRLFNEGERYTLRREGELTIVGYEPWGPPRPAHAWMAEMAFGDLVGNGQAMCGGGLEIRAVRLRRPAPADPGPFTALLGPVEFSALVDEVVLATASLASPMPQADPAMHAWFERFAAGQLARLPAEASLRAKVRARIEAELHAGPPDVAALARDLGLAPRTLQRRLRDEGETLQGLVESVRRARASALLATSMPLSEVSYLLGYAEPSAFFRAFRRWTGETPETCRARLR